MKAGQDLDEEPRATINSYLAAAGLLLRRLRWDLQPSSFVSRKNLHSWRNRFRGHRALILCNGPSLNRVDFNLLQQHKLFTFGLNKINLLFSKMKFRPSAIVAVNPLVIEQNAGFFNETALPLFLDSQGRKWVQPGNNVCFLHSANISGKFARDCSLSVNQGGTVTYLAMQLAFHMGFTTVAIVGCDHSFATKGPANKTVVAGQYDGDHFDTRYFSAGMKWQLPDLRCSELHYEVARNTYERYGRKIINCTDGGKLEIFERQSLEAFLSSQTHIRGQHEP